MLMTVATQESRVHGVQQHSYRGRVRSGCLTCRSRKVKCDEMRPTCKNCRRLERHCVYKPRKSQLPSATVLSPGSVALDDSLHLSEASQSPETATVTSSQPSPSSLFEGQNGVLAESIRLDGATNISWGAVRDPFLSPDSSIVDVTARLQNALRLRNEMAVTADNTEFDAASPSILISRDIELTTTMDLLAAREVALQPLFSFFVEAVDCPSITPYDGINWRRMKLDVVDLGMSNAAVASAITAVSVLYKGQLYSLPLSKALSLYQSSRSAYEELLNDKTQNFVTILAATFLLCLFEFVHYETVPLLKEPSEEFIKRLENWTQQESSRSGLSSRIVAWLRLLHAITIRGGGMGLITDRVSTLFPCYRAGIPNIKSPPSHYSDVSTHLYEMLSGPIFDFYFQLQMISGEIAKLTHYHRSRTTGVDQEEIVQQIKHIKSRLRTLWESRSAPQRQTSADLRAHLAPKIANPIIKLTGLCAAAYHAEFVEMDRVIGDPVSESPDSRRAMRLIRDIIDGDSNAYDGSDGDNGNGNGKLNSGYLRPLFLYAIECMDRDENRWAVARLQQIQNPICRSEFFAAFGKALSDAQLRKERRVTSKYFCIRYFGVPPPFM